MKKLLNSWAFTAALTVLGGGLGYLVYHFWGCRRGCAITGSPLYSVLVAALLGFLIAQLIRPGKEK